MNLEERYKKVKEAFRELKPEIVEIGPNPWKLEKIKDKYYYVRGKDKIEMDVIAELKVTSKFANDLLEKYSKNE